MRTRDRTILLQEVVTLARARPDWLRPMSVHISVRSDQEGEVRTQFALDGSSLRSELSQMTILGGPAAGRQVLLPVHRSAEPKLLAGERFALSTVAGKKELPAFHCAQLLHAPLVSPPLPQDFNKELIVVINDSDVEMSLELGTTVPFSPVGDIRVGRVLSRIIGTVNPVGLLDVELRPDLRVGTLYLDLPLEIESREVVLTYDTKLQAPLSQLRSLEEGYAQFTMPVMRGPIVDRELSDLRALLVQAKQTVDEALSGIQAIYAANGSTAVAKLQDASVLLRTLEQEAQQTRARVHGQRAGGGVETLASSELRAIATKAVQYCESVQYVNVPFQYQAESEAFGSRTVVPCCNELALKLVSIVYSTRLKAIRQGRRSTAWALAIMGGVLLLIAWRYQVMNPLSRQESQPIESARSEALRGSREALVALLVVFPALLYTQVDRIGERRSLLDRSVGMVLTGAALAFLAPIGVAVLTLGDIRPNLVIDACLTAGIALVLIAAALWFVLRDSVVERLRGRACRRRVRQ